MSNLLEVYFQWGLITPESAAHVASSLVQNVEVMLSQSLKQHRSKSASLPFHSDLLNQRLAALSASLHTRSPPRSSRNVKTTSLNGTQPSKKRPEQKSCAQGWAKGLFEAPRKTHTLISRPSPRPSGRRAISLTRCPSLTRTPCVSHCSPCHEPCGPEASVRAWA